MSSTTRDSKAYHRIVHAWCMYDWANSAFATTILGAVLPIYYSQVAGATLPSEAVATAYWSVGLSVSLLIVAVLAPILGTVSDVMRGKKRFLAAFASMGIVGTGMLILVNTGDWLLASILFVLARIGFTSANVFYDALLPHVATEEDQDRVSARGYAMGYLGGGLLLAVNVVMIQVLPGTWGPRLSFLSVALWWAIFSIPVLTRVAEPPAATARADVGRNVVAISFNRLRDTLKDIRQYRELFKFLVAFLIYIDGVGTIIGVAAIYGAELGFGSVELILALLLVQFVGIPFSLIFGRLPSAKEARRPLYLAFILFNLVALPLVGAVGARVLPDEVVGAPLPAYTATSTAVGQGTYGADDPAVQYSGAWERVVIPADELGEDVDANYYQTGEPDARYTLAFNGQRIKVFYSLGPDRGIWTAELDGEPYLDEDTGQPLRQDGYSATVRHGTSYTFQAEEPGEHVLTLINLGEGDASSQGTLLMVAKAEILPPMRQSQLPLIIGMILALEALGLGFAWVLGRPLFAGLAEQMNTKRSIVLALVVYSVIAVWGYFLDSVIEFWFLAWMVAMVQGGSQALSRSLYASMSPAAKSGEFFGLFGIMEKFSAIIGPALFAAAVALTGSSRPAVLSLIAFFVIGIVVLSRVNVDEGRQVAREEDARAGLKRA
jgi:UMF1 family MFS transporter